MLNKLLKGKKLIMAISNCHVSDYDIVICVNRLTDYEKPTILYTSTIRYKIELKTIVCPYPVDAYDLKKKGFVNKVIQKLSQNHELILGNKKIYNKWARRYNTRLYTGVATVLDLTRYDFKSLHISGMTFFKGCGDKERQRQAWNKCHDPEANRLIMRELCTDKKIIPDKTLSELLKKDKVKWKN